MRVKQICLFVLLMIAAVACKYDDGEIWEKVNSLDDRLSSLEGRLTEMNSDISSLSALVNASKDNLGVSDVKETGSGYEISFSDGTTVKINHGKNGVDGVSPVIGVDKADDGLYYWTQTINGQTSWLTDSAGNKMAVSGTGAVTPLLKVNGSGYWMVSYDGGISYTEILDEAGKPVKAVGEDGADGSDGASGSSFFRDVYVDNNTLHLILADGTDITFPVTGGSTSGIPVETKRNPTIEGEPNVEIPNFQYFMEEGSDNKVMRLSMTGIQKPDGDFLELLGTGVTGQNVWIEIDGKPTGFEVINGEQQRMLRAASRAKADVVFLVDNSGSMSEEAEAVAREILDWSATLSQTMDVQFGCVGNEWNVVNGAIDITDAEGLSDYLNRSGVSGTRRTMGFGGANATTLQNLANSGAYRTSGDECGGIMLRFADENFSFRPGANRIYVHFTDEPNQAGNEQRWSVESVNPSCSFYEWDVTKGTIHVVFSEQSSYRPEWSGWQALLREDPRLFAAYTGGTLLDVPSSFAGVTLDSLPVTGAITHSYIIRFDVTPDLLTGSHTVKITILSPDGTIKAEKVFTVTFTV